MVVVQVLCHYEFMIEIGPLMSENQVKKSMSYVASPHLKRLEEGSLQLVLSEPRFKRLWNIIKLKRYLHSIMLA